MCDCYVCSCIVFDSGQLLVTVLVWIRFSSQFASDSLVCLICVCVIVSDTLDASAKEVDGVGIGVNEHLPELHESTEPERSQRNGRYNMRKSLAWDSAFFTSAGNLSIFLPESSNFDRSSLVWNWIECCS